MHKYQPRLHVVEADDINNLDWDNFKTFIFPGTQFTTVTAYQNDKVSESFLWRCCYYMSTPYFPSRL